MPGQVWGTDSLGGYMYSDQLSHELRMAVQPVLRFRHLSDVKDASQQGLHKGDTFRWNRYSDVATAGTTLTEGTAMPETNYTVSQGELTITEYGNSVPYTGKLDDLSYHPVREVVRKVLKNDAKKALDAGAAAEFDSTPLRVTSTAAAAGAITLTTNGTTAVVNDVALSNTHVKNIIDIMKERNIPAYLGDDYYAVAWPTTFRDFKDDLEAIHQYVETGFRFIMNGEIGRYEGCRFVEQTNIAKGAIGTSAGAWSNGNDWCVFMGEDTVAEGIAIPEEIRGKIPTDYGRSKGVAWYYLGGFGIVHDDAPNARILIWDSAS